jgi:hypothetical protein
MSKFWKN